MTTPNNDELDTAIEKLLEAAEKKAYSEAKQDNQFDFEGNPSNSAGPSQTQKDRIDEGLADLKKRFELIYTPHPNELNVLIDTMQGVESTMGIYNGGSEDEDDGDELIGGGKDLGNIDTAKSEIQTDWDGDLRDNLIDNYLSPMSPGIIGTQGNLARFLRVQAEIMQKIYTRRRADAKKIAEDGTAAIEAIQDSKGSDIAIALAAVIAAATLAAGLAPLAPATAQLAVSLSTAMAAAGPTLGDAFVPDDKQVPLGADTVEEVVDNIHAALNDSDATMEEEEEAVNEALKNIQSVVAPMTSKPTNEATDLVPMWPDLVNTSSPEDLREGMTSYPDDK